MAATESSMLKLGTEAPNFELPDVVSGNSISLKSLSNDKGLGIFFICNHCPYVIHSINAIVNITNKYLPLGVNFAAISSNDIIEYPADSPDKMKLFAQKYGLKIPYLYDESQEVAKAYQAECTPDNYLFDAKNKLVYRGRLDPSRPYGSESTGSEYLGAINAMLAHQSISEIQYPSIGCNIKWK